MAASHDILTTSVTDDLQSLDESVMCRICHGSEPPFIAPCSCRGTMSYVHKPCLEAWLLGSWTDKCDICRFRFRVKKTAKYWPPRGIWIWLTNVATWRELRALILGLLVVTTNTLHWLVTKPKEMDEVKPFPQIILFTFLFHLYFFWVLYLYRGSQWIRWYRNTYELSLVDYPLITTKRGCPADDNQPSTSGAQR